ncbi:hypothetical protein PPERSA_02320 [Pseudocohnilembus persalinus]|uniref:Adenosine deaminase domain-containing protein n=1 Tax=Pseudocohnilembus persalinus TaxID=266149 RepID=A0A0V0QTY9_PSEPJ|nr:hypothetical protein PPERSA_02320 [Pseudocohnilembus persalinus]|eukprot:KRX05788.1 hypothetical protein PPERSA_02320 [Pseudocohnilembus persalinus]
MDQDNLNNNIQNIFKKLPKGCDLHVQYNSVIDYDEILLEMEKSTIYDTILYDKQKQVFRIVDAQTYYKNEKFQDKDLYAKYFKNEKYIRELISKELQQQIRLSKVKQQPENQQKEDGDENSNSQEQEQQSQDLQQQENEDSQENNLQVEQFDTDQFLSEYRTLNSLFQNILGSDIFFKNYCSLLFEHMEQQAINLLEIRMKVDLKEIKKHVNFKQLLDCLIGLNEQNIRNNRQVRIIASFNRNQQNLEENVLEFLNFLNERKKYKLIINGIDFNGQELAGINKELMENEEILNLMKKLNIQFYNSVGEMLIKSEYQEYFGWQDNHNLNNVLYQLEHKQKYPDIYKKPVRIGNGIIFLQWLDFLQRSQKDENLSQEQKAENKVQYEKYEKLSQNVCFEVSPFSNLIFYGNQLEKQIFEKYADRICLCGDNQNKIDMNLSNVFHYLFLNLEVSYDSMIKMIKNSIKFSGLDTVIIKEIEKQFEKDLEEWEDEYKQQIIESQGQEEHKLIFQKPWWQYETYKVYKRATR